ncbi:hypothetical protein B2J88_12240 [Rhodococcus sp. SRB_17]|nr:hypothetical protein [Rhodococcus sp. SRB_17]
MRNYGHIKVCETAIRACVRLQQIPQAVRCRHEPAVFLPTMKLQPSQLPKMLVQGASPVDAPFFLARSFAIQSLDVFR